MVRRAGNEKHGKIKNPRAAWRRTGSRQIEGGYAPMGILARKQRIRNTGYILPDILHSYEEYRRFHNMDLKEMDVFSLWQELFKVKMALAYIDPHRQPWLFVEPGKFVAAIDWLKAREAAIRAELRRRGRESA